MIKTDLLTVLNAKKFDGIFEVLYGEDNVDGARLRYKNAIDSFETMYGDSDKISLFSVAGRSEIMGNHTDHQNGCVMAAAIDLDIIAVARKTDTGYIRIKSEGFDEIMVNLDDLEKYRAPFKASSIVAGVVDGFIKHGFKIGSFDAYTTSNVLRGSGLSSSAAFEDMVGNILRTFYNGYNQIDNVTLAKISQYAENYFFGKPCGLMDQIACAYGGFVKIDFEEHGNPKVERINFDLEKHGYKLCIVNTGGNHADLNEDYASVPAEMKSVAEHFGKTRLRSVTMPDLLEAASEIRQKTGDRALLRAIHFVNENKRVQLAANALADGNIDKFLEFVRESGRSSFEYLQNVYTTKNVSEQGLSLAIAYGEQLMSEGAIRVHGGGFAGTIQAFVKLDEVGEFKKYMDALFGRGATKVLGIRPYGAICIAD